MTEHLITDEIKSYLKREMPPAELLKADDHILHCEACFQKVKDLSGEAADFVFQPAVSEETEHLSYQQMENYADEKADDVEREITDVHLKACDHCRAELDGLLEMRKLVEADLQKQVLTEKPAVSWFENFFSGGFVLKFGFAAVALVIFALAVFLLSRRDAPAPEIAANKSPSNINTPVVSTPTPANSTPDTEINAPPNVNTNLQNQPPTEDKKNELPPAYQAEIERVLAVNRLNLPAELSGLKGQSGKLMSGGSSEVPFALENPLGKIIQTDRPQFRWRALEGANGYIVNVYDENYNRVAGSGQIKTTNWQIDRPLARSRIYIWQVTAVKDGQEIKSPVRPAPDAKFKVLDAARANALARLSREYKNEHLALGILYANAGLLTEAAREFQRELAKNPNSKQARKFLQDVRSRK